MKIYQNCHVNIDQTDILAVGSALEEASISGKGPSVERYERLLRSFFQSPYAICCSNGTAGIHMILILEKIQEGDEVLIPPTAPVMCILPIIAVGATPVFVDTEPDSFNLSLEDLHRKRTARTRLLINVPMWGYANNIEEIAGYCQSYGIKVLEDNSHCHGTLSGGRPLGTAGDYAVFSTHERKLIATGEGGFILIKEKDDYEKLLEIRSFGEVARSGDVDPGIRGAYGYYFGLNFKLSAINAALGITQLAKLNEKIARRRENARFMESRMSDLCKGIVELRTRAGSVSNYYSIVFLADPALRLKIELALRNNGVISDPLRYQYRPLYEMPLFATYVKRCLNAEKLMQSVFTVPVHEAISQEDMEYFTFIIKEVNHD